MSENQGVIVQKPGEAKVAPTTIPKLRDDYIIVKVKAVALNPTDWKHIDYVTTAGARIGCDYAGIVEEVGSAVTKPFKKGTRVSGFAHGGNEVNHEDGAFANYITAKGDLQIEIPENLSLEEAATLGVGISTVGQALYQALDLPLPGEPSKGGEAILIYGGSSATGSLAIQYAKLSGLEVITTCSPHNFDYIKSLGADAVYDYKSDTCSKDINEYTQNKLIYAFDCISGGASPAITIGALSTTLRSIYTTLVPVPDADVAAINPLVINKLTLAYTMLGEYFTFGPKELPAKSEDLEFGKRFWELSRGLLEVGKVKVHRPAVDKYGKGLEGVLKGLDAMRKGEVSGEKLVFTL